jgi:4'-phosphopantetheinyl transferase EntD
MPDSITFQFEFNQDSIRSFFTKEKICLAPSQIGLPINHQFSDKRFADFSTGRYCAINAIEQLGFNNIEIPIGQEREPIWPEGLVGSISHCDSLTGSIVAKRANYFSVGLDIEEMGKVTSELWDFIFTENEKRYLKGLNNIKIQEMSTILFSIKEAFYKFQFPITKTFLDFLDVEIQLPSINQVFVLAETISSDSLIRSNRVYYYIFNACVIVIILPR